jgi:hypothetical protein
MGARISAFDAVGKRKSIKVEIEPDSTALLISSEPVGLSLIHLTTSPATAGLRFDFEQPQGEPVDMAAVGSGGNRPLGDAFIVRPEDAIGLPNAFPGGRSSGEPGIYLWWLPGGGALGTQESTELTPEERARLKALGYLQ